MYSLTCGCPDPSRCLAAPQCAVYSEYRSYWDSLSLAERSDILDALATDDG